MKNQYFGDNKDLFTYDLVMHVMQSGVVEHFTFIPMLTLDDDKAHGEKRDRGKARVGTQNKELLGFLDDCIKQRKRGIGQLEKFFAGHGISMTIYKKNDYFLHAERREYFGQIGSDLLSRSLIFVDPDNGLEVKRSTEQHILYSEVIDLYRRMDRGSVLMLYQYLPRQPHLEYLNMRCEEIKEKVLGDYPISIDDDEIAFFFLTKDKKLEDKLIHVIGEYNERYSK